MIVFIWIFIFLILLRGINTLIFLIQSLLWLKDEGGNHKPADLKKDLYILIPALREQNRIIDTLKYFIKEFKDNKIHIIVVTSEKEYEKKFEGKSTRELVENFIRDNRLEERIRCFNYPKRKGLVAHQLNFAISKINKNDSYIAVYNADSRPNPQTFKIFSQELIKNPKAKVFQQPALYLNIFDQIKSNLFIKIFLQACAIQQTRFTLTHELSALRRQSSNGESFLKKYFNSYCVTHGLIINIDTLRSINGFPETSITEDLFIGYLLKSKQITIYPLPVLENADSPKTIRGLWDQQYVWFWGPMKYLYYFGYIIKKKKKLKITNIKVPFILMLQGVWSALAWLFSGVAILMAFAFAAISRDQFLFLLFLIAFFIYYPLQYMLIAYLFPFLFKCAGEVHKSLSFPLIISIGVMSIPAVLFHNLPPFFSIASEINNLIFNKPIYKPKTDDQISNSRSIGK